MAQFILYLFSVSGAKEIDIAATLEHIRDQRMNMVKTKVRRNDGQSFKVELNF